MNRNNNNKNKNKNVKSIALAVLIIIASTIVGSTAFAGLAYADHVRFVEQTHRSSSAYTDLIKSVPADGGDYVIFHYGNGQTPTDQQISDMKAINTISNTHKGFEFFSLTQIQSALPKLKSAGFSIISYDLEANLSPSNETSNPVQSFTTARNMIRDFNSANGTSIVLQAAPSYKITNENGAQIAPLVGRYHIQSQTLQDADTTCASMKSFVDSKTRQLENANSNLGGKITYQVTLSSQPAPGKTIQQTVHDCITAVSPTVVDGGTIWTNSAAFDDGTYLTELKYLNTK